MDRADQTQTETKRDRVRRLLIQPLADRGFRFKAGTPAERQRELLDQLADDMAYLSDESLQVLEQCMRAKGEGTSRCFWPSLATFDGFAQAREPRPLGELPAVLRWFASAAGRAALDGDRLVAEYLFWQRHRRPPVRQLEQQAVAEEAARINRQAEAIRDRRDRGGAPTSDDLAWLAWHDDLLARVRSYLRAVEGDAA